MPDTRYVKYRDDLEQIKPNEDETIDKIIASMTRESEKTTQRYRHSVRASHAKSTGLLKGELRVLDGLPEPLRQGLFAHAATYPVLVRLAQGPGEMLKDSVSTHRGMSIKVLGVEGPKLPGHDAPTQDSVFASGRSFPASDAAHFLLNMRGLEASASMPEAVKHAISATARGTNAALNAVGGNSAMMDFFGHTPRHPLADAYFSQAAMRYGDYVAKIGVFPVSLEEVGLEDGPLDIEDPDTFRHAVVGFFNDQSMTFEMRVQLCTDPDKMPVEDAAKVWSEEESPYVPVARLVLPAQAAHSEARAAYFNDVLSFRPAHSLAAHRPLGSLMRARLKTYQGLQALRHRHNGVAEVEPTTLADVPD